MTLIITAAAALVVTALRFFLPKQGARLHLGALALMYAGASLMWCVDGIASLVEGESFVELADASAMADDALLGAYVIGLGLLAWLVVLVFKRITTRRTAGEAH
ncbi:MAG: hypothetical protein LBD25_02230 [Coriobacteriales bacterium]|jgi:hypothetical protein|nr:hypothetical protein [Coriobacteriales bacterium]